MRDPGSKWNPIPEWNAGRYTKTQFIVHSTGTKASAANNARYFARPDVSVESTFVVGYGPSDPTLQLTDSRARADANTTASRRAISVEVVGTGDEPFTDWQVAELIRLGRWAADEHPIARRVCPTHSSSGFGWHVMFGAPGPWTNVRGKVCPGARRAAQLLAVVFPAIFRRQTSTDLPDLETTNPPVLEPDPFTGGIRMALLARNGRTKNRLILESGAGVTLVGGLSNVLVDGWAADGVPFAGATPEDLDTLQAAANRVVGCGPDADK